MHRIIYGTKGYQINTNFAHALCDLEKTIETKRTNTSAIGWFKNAFSSETDKIMLGITFSHYLGIKQCRKPKIENFYSFFHPVQAL